ncbi:MAG: nitrate reductase [Ignavibacteria bacterium GWF2_33_9]|nr:MAG: nitrate reductase [Ignavibacteria bacterium GWF2_33_9]
MNQFSRRKFLKISAATFGTAAVATGVGSTLSKTSAKAQEKAAKGVKQIPTYCDICFWKCGAIGHVKDGKLWKITGNPLDDLSKGRLCTRGTGGVGYYFSEERLQQPLIRQKGTERGDDKWVVVTWDEAFTFIADKMQEIKKNYGAKAFSLFSHGQGGAFFKHTLKAFGSYNEGAPSYAQCKGPRETGFVLTFGEHVGSPERVDIKNSKCIALLGVHIGENVHNSLLQEFSEAMKNGASLIVADPRYSIAASKSKFYLPIKAGTDIALLLAWMNVLVTENIYNKEFVANYGIGFEQFAQEVAAYSPEWAYAETGIDPELIRESARELAKNAPESVIHPGRHTTKYGDDSQRLRAIALVNALLGNWNQKGGFFQPNSIKVPAYPYPAYPAKDYELADNPGGMWPFADEAVSTGIRETTITEEPYPIKGWFVYATNLIHSMPDRQKTLEAIDNLDLLVVTDIFPTEITGYADVVLPESSYLERFDELFAPAFRRPSILIRQPIVEPPNGQKPAWWMAKKLAEKLNLGHYYPWNDIEDYLRTRVESAGFSYDKLKKDGVVYGSTKPLYESEGAEMNFYTPSGKVEFYSQQLLDAGFDPVPKFTRHEEPTPGFYRLLFGRLPMHTFSKTQANPILHDMKSENEVWVNADVAESWGIKNGQYIRLMNQDGVMSNTVKTKVTEMIRKDCVYLPHGFGQTSERLKSTYLKGASDAGLITNVKIDPLMGGTAMNLNFVTLVTEDSWQG